MLRRNIGRRIVDLQASLMLINHRNEMQPPSQDTSDRETFTHPALEGLTQLTDASHKAVIDVKRLSALGQQHGVDQVLRWKPRLVRLNAMQS